MGKTEPFSKNFFKNFWHFRKCGERMGRKQLRRETERENLARLEEAARTEADFKAVIADWNHLDENRERKERYHEKQRGEIPLEVGYNDGIIFPIPLSYPAWWESIKGDFLSVICYNAKDMWQLIEDWDVGALVKNLTDKQKDVLFLSAVRLCKFAQIARCHDKTDRAVRKLLAATLDSIRVKLAPLIREQIKAGSPQMTPAKREFLAWYSNEKAAALDSDKDG